MCACVYDIQEEFVSLYWFDIPYLVLLYAKQCVLKYNPTMEWNKSVSEFLLVTFSGSTMYVKQQNIQSKYCWLEIVKTELE